MNIGKYVEMYSNDLKLKNYSQNTIDNYVSQVTLFLKHFESVANKPSEINENKIKEWLLLTEYYESIESYEDRLPLRDEFEAAFKPMRLTTSK